MYLLSFIIILFPINYLLLTCILDYGWSITFCICEGYRLVNYISSFVLNQPNSMCFLLIISTCNGCLYHRDATHLSLSLSHYHFSYE